MPSPFPGMDPFIESQRWESFHHQMISVIAEFLVPKVRPKYFAMPEERVYVQWEDGEPYRAIQPDVAVVRGEQPESDIVSEAVVGVIEPTTVALAVPETIRDSYLTIRDARDEHVVTVIEVLSPTNKRIGAEARAEYLLKRHQILVSSTNLVEIDLLRGGGRLPTSDPMPPGDYYALICRSDHHYQADVYGWPMLHRLPKIPIPLAGGDPDVWLDLQAVFSTVYDRSGFDYALRYNQLPTPELNALELNQVEFFLRSRS